MVRIGEDRTERLDIAPAQLRVIVTARPKYACRVCEEGVTQARAPAHLIEGGLPTEGALAHVLVSKFEEVTAKLLPATVAQHLATLRMFFDWLVVGQVPPFNPASSVRGPWHVINTGKTPVLSAKETRTLPDSIGVSTMMGRALPRHVARRTIAP